MISGILDKVALAMCQQAIIGGTAEQSTEHWRALARVAIEAMREPTEAMAEAARRSAPYVMREPTEMWPVMIDEALRQAPTSKVIAAPVR